MFLFALAVKISLMAKRAVIRINGKQYEVEEGKELLIDKISGEEINPEVLLIFEGNNVEVGNPLLKKAKVELEILEDVKGKKLEVSKYKAKSRYRRRRGFRPLFTKVLVKTIKLA